MVLNFYSKSEFFGTFELGHQGPFTGNNSSGEGEHEYIWMSISRNLRGEKFLINWKVFPKRTILFKDFFTMLVLTSQPPETFSRCPKLTLLLRF
jgi:hypothetical protein